MEKDKVVIGGGTDGGDEKPTTVELVEEINPNSTIVTESVVAEPTRQNSRTPFANLSQVDADLALARTLQEQERAYMMLSMNHEGNDDGESDDGSWETVSDLNDLNDTDEGDDDADDDDAEDDDDDDDEDDDDDDDEDDDDAFDVHAHDDSGEDDVHGVEIDPSAYPDDEAYARALQNAEHLEFTSRLLSLHGLNDTVVEAEYVEDHGDNSQDTWDGVDPDELSYEELIALGDVVGTESRGLSSAKIASLPSINYKAQNKQDAINDLCVICRLDFEDGETLTVLSCKHSYHSECINNWLQINKVCPVCSTEVSSSENL